jgi:hypothetical protein
VKPDDPTDFFRMNSNILPNGGVSANRKPIRFMDPRDSG